MTAPYPTTADIASRHYGVLTERMAAARCRVARPLTLAEKVLAAHAVADAPPVPERGHTYVGFHPDRVVMQDAMAQMALLQVMVADVEHVAVPASVHCDHLITAARGATDDLQRALDTNGEVYEFLRSAAARYGIGFWQPGSGIIHQVVLEHEAFPGGMMIGTDSHTPNAGGLGMIAIGVGGADAVDAMVGLPFELRWPRLIGVWLTGAPSGWTTAKDVILEVARRLTVSGGTGAIVEYFGPGVAALAPTGRATICNMGAEIGATTSIFPFDERTAAYLEATDRTDVVDAARKVERDLRADPEVETDPARFFDAVIEIDLSTLTPRVNGPDTPDLAHELDEVGAWARAHDVPTEISACLVGSCTNSSYEDISRAASIARQAEARGLRARTRLLVTPGSEQVRATVERDGLLADLEAIGAEVLANACGPCIGQWDRGGVDPDRPNTIVTSFNRNFSGRNDGSLSTKAFLASPETVVAYALAGTLEFDPRTDVLAGRTLEAPSGRDLPERGYACTLSGLVVPPVDALDVDVVIDPASERIARLVPFRPPEPGDFADLPVLVKAQGKCTTDQISAAGRWLRYRGHLEHISANLFLGAVNAFTGAVGEGKDPLDGETRPFPEIARRLAAAGKTWCAVGDENYGEGSSREHAAMEPRHRGCVAVIARSFARIHETNLKKHGVLALTFADPAVYDAIGEDDRVSLLGLDDVASGSSVRARVTRADGSAVDFECEHTMSAEQIEWWRAGSALNLIRQRSLA
jgi:aconitate hydratase